MHERYFQRTLSIIQAARNHYQNAHWLCQGPSFYGDHLLYERLYENIEEEVDSFAERMIGLFGPGSFSIESHQRTIKIMSEKWAKTDCLVRRSIKVEKTVLGFLRKTKSELERNGELTLGLEDFLPAVASQHETHLYLLKQRLRGSD